MSIHEEKLKDFSITSGSCIHCFLYSKYKGIQGRSGI